MNEWQFGTLRVVDGCDHRIIIIVKERTKKAVFGVWNDVGIS